MKRRSLSELTILLFEPRAPLLFLIGSLALAIFGNAIYDLLIAAFDASPQALASLTLTTSIIFVFAIYAFQRLVGAIEQRRWRGVSIVAPDEAATACASLILPVGLKLDGPERAIINWHLQAQTLRHCWLIVTPEVKTSPKFSDLRQELIEQNVDVHMQSIEHPNQAYLSYQATCEAIAEARRKRNAQPLIVDITSGIKAMTAGMVVACRDLGAPIQYLPAPRDAIGQPQIQADLRPMMVRLRPEEEETRS